MKHTYKYISFVKIEQKPKTEIYRCINNRSNEELGIVRWYSAWRRYCYFPTVQATYSADCLGDIKQFIGALK